MSVNADAVICKLQIRFETGLLHMTGQTILFLHAPAQLHRLVIRCVAAKAFFRVSKIGSRASIAVRIVASQARDGFAGAKAAACQESDRSKSYGNGIFQFGFFAHLGRGKPVTLATDLDLGSGGKTSGIDYFFSQLFFRSAAFRCLYVGASRSVATFALNAGPQGSQAKLVP